MGCATVGVRATLMLTGWVPDNELGAQGAAALAGALGQLMNLTRLNLECTWNVEWAVSCGVASCSSCTAMRLMLECYARE